MNDNSVKVLMGFIEEILNPKPKAEETEEVSPFEVWVVLDEV